MFSTYEKPTFELMTYGELKVWPFVFDTEEEKIKFMEELQDLIGKISERIFTRRSSSADKRGPPKLQAVSDVVVFECEYYDKRVVEIPRNNLSFQVLIWSVLEQFQVDGVTILYGDRYVDSQQELDDMLVDGSSHYSVLLYDSYVYE